MNRPLPNLSSAPSAAWRAYRDNLPRHLIGVSRYLQTSLMQLLEDKHGYRGLRLSYEPFISLVGSKGARLTDLARWLDISKQAVNQTANQVEAAGLIERRPDPADGRAKILVLTKDGQKLVRQSAALAAETEQACIDAVGKRRLTRMAGVLREVYQAFGLPHLQVQTPYTSQVLLSSLLPRIADACMQKLMHLNMDKGHTQLKMSYAQVLSLIGPDGGDIQQMAAIQAVSKQAISAIASELEALAYIERIGHPQDARRIVLQLTDQGQELLQDSVDSITVLNTEIASIVGAAALLELQSIAADIYHTLGLEDEVFRNRRLNGVNALAVQLRSQLKPSELTQLSKLLAT